jgi:hypothetical protein
MEATSESEPGFLAIVLGNEVGVSTTLVVAVISCATQWSWFTTSHHDDGDDGWACGGSGS